MISYKVKRQQRFIVILLGVLFGGASLINLGSLDTPLDPAIATLRLSIIGVVLLFFAIMSGSEIWNIPTKPVPLVLVWVIYSFAFILSGFANNDLIMLRDGFWSMIAVPVLFFNALPKLMKKSANILITLGLLLGLSPYIVLSLILQPVWQSDAKIYSGIFPNSNQLGFTATAISSGFFILMIGFLFSNKKSFQTTLINISLAICLVIILLSNARTSLIAFFTMSLILLWKLFQKGRNIVIATISSLVISGIILLLSSQNPWLFERISEIGGKDALSGRDDIWAQTLLDLKLLGNGEKYFENNFNLGAHNTIVHILGVNGIIAGLGMILFAIFSFYYAVLFFKKNYHRDNYAIAPLMFITCFWTLSMGEGMFGSLGNAMTLAYMLSIGVIIADLNIKQDNVTTAIQLIDKNIIDK